MDLDRCHEDYCSVKFKVFVKTFLICELHYYLILFYNTLTFFTEMIIQIKLKIKKGCRRRNLGFRAWGTGSPSQRAANGGISAKTLFFVYSFQL